MWKTGISDSGIERLAKRMNAEEEETTWYGPEGEFEPSSIQKQVYNALLSAAEKISRAEYQSYSRSKGRPPKTIIPSAEAETLLDAAQSVMSGSMDPEEAMNLLRVPEIERKRFNN